MTCWKWPISVYLLVLSWNSTFGWRWKTTDAIILDVSHENEQVKFKRAPSIEIMTSTDLQQPPSTNKETAAADQDEDEGSLVFEGHYFKPNEVPPPPPFMVANNNWHGAPPSKITQKQPLSKGSSFYYVTTVGTGTRLPPISHKFTEENAKDFSRNGNTITEKRLSSSSKSASSSPSISVEDLSYSEELSITNDSFQDAPKCFTTSDTEGRCVPFKQCYPVVFNVIDGDLRNPALAKLLYQSSGPCNATLELDFALNKSKDDKTFFQAKFYNQSICCPKFKHPPALLRSQEEDDVRSTRLITNDNKKSVPTPASILIRITPSGSTAVRTITTGHIENDDTQPDFPASGGSLSSTNRPLGMEDSSVEVTENEFSSSNDNTDVAKDDVDADDDDDDEEDENIRIAVATEIVKENSTAKMEDELVFVEDRRGDREKGSGSVSASSTSVKSPADPLLSVHAPNLSPNKCRHQIYGMPRGHWPWMVALVISSRHICSGALVDERHVVTAAHCVYLLDDADVKKLRIIIGDRVMYSSVDGPHFWRKVTKIITHVNYNQQTFASDIAILKLNSDVPFSRNVQPISLNDLVSPVDGSSFGKGIVAGWSGADIGQPSFESRTEVETVVDIMDKTECRDVYRGFALSGVATNTFCTKPANNTCVADSGAPLIVRVQNCWILAGVMSWGLGCSHFPEVYTDVTRYTSWIRKHTV